MMSGEEKTNSRHYCAIQYYIYLFILYFDNIIEVRFDNRLKVAWTLELILSCFCNDSWEMVWDMYRSLTSSA